MSATLPAVGEILGGRYELREILGEGGMSVVFLARDHVSGHDIALKLLAPRYLGRPEREQRLLDEGRYLGRLGEVPGIVEILDHGRFADRQAWPYLATALLEGRTLNWLLIKHRFTHTQLRDLALALARTVEGCHDAGIVHRDLTPSNVAVTLEPLRVQLFDFSHAANIDEPSLGPGVSSRLTGFFDVPGTSGYMSPEQAAAAPADAKMDVFAFGVLLYELITGRNPFPNVSHEQFVELQRRGSLDAPRLETWAYEVDPKWAEVIADCTQPDPSKRPTMAEVAHEIAQGGASFAGPHKNRPRQGGRRLMLSLVLLAVGLAALIWAGIDPAQWRGGQSRVMSHNPPGNTEQPTQENQPPSPVEPVAATSADPDQDPEPKRVKATPIKATPIKAIPARLQLDCAGVEAEADRARRARDWAAVLRHTGKTSCWSSTEARLRLRIEALAQARRWDECQRLADASSDPDLARWAKFCAKNI